MARNIPVGNGRLLACFDDEYCMRDLYFPHVGQENHLGGNHGRFGVWVEGAFSWVGPDWERDLRYEDDTLVTRVRLRHETLGLAIECRDTASRHLWREEHNRFYRGLYRDDQGKLEVDMTADASLWGLFAFGLYSVQDPRIEKTMTALRERLWVKTAVGGMARHEDDDYYRSTQEATGNPWFVCTLWLDNSITWWSVPAMKRRSRRRSKRSFGSRSTHSLRGFSPSRSIRLRASRFPFPPSPGATPPWWPPRSGS